MGTEYTRRLLCTTIIAFAGYSGVIHAEEMGNTISKGRETFITSCSLCHGDSATGDGMFASMLTVATSDLTQLSKNNNGVFPFKEVYLTIDGRDQIKQHGPRHMPIWGDHFHSSSWFSVSEEHADTLVRGKLFELMFYLESIQEK